MTQDGTPSLRFSFWPWARWLFVWILVTALGGAIAYPSLILIGTGAVDAGLTDLLAAFTYIAAPLAGVIGGAVAGFGQWLVMRRSKPRTHTWTLLSILAWAAGFFVTTALFFWLASDGLNYVTLVFPLVGGGAAAGLFHVPVIRRWVRGAAWWVLAMSSGWVLGWVTGWALLAQFVLNPAIPESGMVIILGGIHGAFIGFQSGLTLIYLLIFVPHEEPVTMERVRVPER